MRPIQAPSVSCVVIWYHGSERRPLLTWYLGNDGSDRGQGLGNAIADAAELQRHIQAMSAHTPAELAKAVRKYEEEVWVRGYDTVMGNLENTMAIHDDKKRVHSPIFVRALNQSGDKVRVPGGIDEELANSSKVMVGEDPAAEDMFARSESM